MQKMNKRTLDKINRINNERKEVLIKIKQGIQEGNSKIIENLNSILQSLDEKDTISKEYITILKVKEMLSSLIKQILEAETLEDVQILRNKINYQINKVKNVLIKKEVPKESLNKYIDKVNVTRNWITEYVRYIKRSSNIASIKSLLLAEYTEERKDEIIKLARSEDKFNKRIKNKELSFEEPKSNKKEPYYDEKSVYISNYSGLRFNSKFANSDINSNKIINIQPEQNPEEETKITDTDKLKKTVAFVPHLNIESQKRKYNIVSPKEYSGNFFDNLVAFISNIPIYRHNKKMLKIMDYEYNTYYGGEDLKQAIELTTELSSIKRALSLIFKNTKLYQHEQLLEEKLASTSLSMSDNSGKYSLLYKNANN